MARGSFISRDERSVIAVLAVSGFSDTDIARMCGRDRSAVSRARRRLGLPAAEQAQPSLIPNDFTEKARQAPSTKLAGLYERSPRTIRRWRKAIGLKPIYFPRMIRRAKRTLWAKPLTFNTEQRAANVLRRHFPNVFRCDLRISERGRETYGSVRGLPDNGSRHWFIAKVGVVDQDTMIAKARELGFVE